LKPLFLFSSIAFSCTPTSRKKILNATYFAKFMNQRGGKRRRKEKVGNIKKAEEMKKR
jgi:hypothetical protein